MTEPECELKFTIESSRSDPGVTEVKGIPVTRGDSMWIKDLKPEILSQLCTRRVGVQFMLPADFVITVKDGAENLVGICVIKLEESAIQINGVCSGPECSQPLRLGSQLIDLTEDIGRQLGKPKIRLVSTPQAYKFYLKKGFKVVPDPENITKQSEMVRPIPQVRAGTRLRLKTLRKSHNKAKKWDAVFEKPDGSTKTVPFGQKGYSDYTKHKDKTRRKRQIDRHSGMGENWNDPTTPGALSRYILWNKPTLQGSLRDFKKRFGV